MFTYAGTEKEIKKEFLSLLHVLKRQKKKTTLNEPRKRKPTEKALEQMENWQGEEEERRKNSKSKKKVRETDVGGEKETQ